MIFGSGVEVGKLSCLDPTPALRFRPAATEFRPLQGGRTQARTRPIPRSGAPDTCLEHRPVADDDRGQDEGADSAGDKQVRLPARPLPFLEDPAPHRGKYD